MCAKSLWPWTPLFHQAPLFMGFSRQEYWSGLPCPPPGDLPDPGMEPHVSCASCIGKRILYHWHHLASPHSTAGDFFLFVLLSQGPFMSFPGPVTLCALSSLKYSWCSLLAIIQVLVLLWIRNSTELGVRRP